VDSWRSAITNADGNRIIVRGHDLVSLMQHGTYADVVALLLGGHMPDEGVQGHPDLCWNLGLIPGNVVNNDFYGQLRTTCYVSCCQK